MPTRFCSTFLVVAPPEMEEDTAFACRARASLGSLHTELSAIVGGLEQVRSLLQRWAAATLQQARALDRLPAMLGEEERAGLREGDEVLTVNRQFAHSAADVADSPRDGARFGTCVLAAVIPSTEQPSSTQSTIVGRSA